jgi:TolB-like protein/DNA-binding winged helix-turn-helix (wHTH) protein/Flp pilus assembly protein TadD
MSARTELRDPVRFGPFLVVPRTRELHKDELLVRLPSVPFEVLCALLERPGDLVTREELRARLWPDGTFVDFDNNLNNAVTRLRQALGDSAEHPQYIETLPRLGYRFLAPIEAPPPATTPPAPVSPARVRLAPRTLLSIGATAAVVVALLVFWTMGPRSAEPPTGAVMLVVLPFDNMSQSADLQYLADGVTEQMITELARIAPARLHIIARTTSFAYKGTEKSVSAIAGELGADFVMEGSVQREGARVRITTQLIEPRTQAHVWAQTYDRDLGDLLAVERDVARAVAVAVRMEVAPASNPAAAEPPAVSVEARDAYMQANFFRAQATVPSIEKAIALYGKAVAIEPTFALAHAGLARALIFSTSTQPGAALASAGQAADRARQLDPELPEAQLAWAMVRLYRDRDLSGAEREFERALALDAGNADAHFYYSHLLAASGRFDEALAAVGRAEALDPHSPLVVHYRGRILIFARRAREALAPLHKALDLEPNYGWALMFLAVAHEQLEQWPEALAARQKYWAVMGVPPARVTQLGEAFASGGYDAVRREWVAWIEGFAKTRGFVTSTELAILHASLGDQDRALHWLRLAQQNDVRDLIYTRIYPEFDRFRADARYREIEAAIFAPSAH